jgi:hypothetical protein
MDFSKCRSGVSPLKLPATYCYNKKSEVIKGAIQMDNSEQLRLLSVFHYILGALEVCFCFMGLLYVFMGLSLVFSPASWTSNGGEMPPPIMGWIFAAIGGLWVLGALIFGILTIVSGRYISQRRNKTFSIVIGAINCLFMPLGTILGIFTIITLSKKEVVDLYENKQNFVDASELA